MQFLFDLIVHLNELRCSARGQVDSIEYVGTDHAVSNGNKFKEAKRESGSR